MNKKILIISLLPLVFVSCNKIIRTYEVKFETNGGSKVSSQIVNDSEFAKRPSEIPVKDGFIFSNWYKDSELKEVFTFESNPIKNNTTIYAGYLELNKFEVSFNSCGGTPVSSQMVNDGELAKKPSEIPVREGYTFTNWYKDYSLTEVFNFDLNPIKSNITIYAGYNINKYNIKFVSNNESAITPQTIEYGGRVVKPKDPFKDNKTFVCWCIDEGLEEEYDFNDLVTKDLTLYAKYTSNALCFTNKSLNRGTVQLNVYGSVDLDFQYSYDGESFNYWSGEKVIIEPNSKIYVKNNSSFLSKSSDDYVNIRFCGGMDIEIIGDSKYLLNNSDYLTSNYCFYKLFEEDIQIKSCKNFKLNFLNLTDYCYSYMFKLCETLIYSPSLVSTNLASHCYEGMFYFCSNLIYPSSLPAKKLYDSCYKEMFLECDSLVSAPELPALILANNCYEKMFHGCGNLTNVFDLPSIELYSYCYYGMFGNCKSLINPPIIKAKILAEYCCYSMFAGCISLRQIPDLFFESLSPYCFSHMFHLCKLFKINDSGYEGSLFFICPVNSDSSCTYNMFLDTAGEYRTAGSSVSGGKYLFFTTVDSE